MLSKQTTFGSTLREWRGRRRLSQLHLALRANISARHLAFLETGRANPSRTMVAQLIEALEVPIRSQNEFLLTAGFAPHCSEFNLSDDALKPLRNGLNRLMERHSPYPALLLDRVWNVVDANRTANMILDVLRADAGDTNVLRILANSPRTAEFIENWPTLAATFVKRLKTEVLHNRDVELEELLREFCAAPNFPTENSLDESDGSPLLLLRVRIPNGPRLALFSAIGQFGTASDVTIADLRLELFFPADAESELLLHQL